MIQVFLNSKVVNYSLALTRIDSFSVILSIFFSSEMHQKINFQDQILDTLQGIGYNGVPARENKESILKIIE